MTILHLVLLITTPPSYGAAITFGYPISEIQRLGLNIAYDHTELQQQGLSSREILDFLESEGSEFDTFKLQGFGQGLL